MRLPAETTELSELRGIYARRAEAADAETVAQLLAAVMRRGEARQASNALAAFRLRRGFCFRDRVRERLDDLVTPRRSVVEAARAWAARVLDASR
jgi:hypothetical protein